jgi:hypothetical protein
MLLDWSHFLRQTGAHFAGKCSGTSIMRFRASHPDDIGQDVMVTVLLGLAVAACLALAF